MLMVASDDGSIRLWRPNIGTSRDPTLVTAWQAFHEPKTKYSGKVEDKDVANLSIQHNFAHFS